ncbi:MAG TPA: RNA polymerase sigma factor [Propionibacteriaceae bacterium]
MGATPAGDVDAALLRSLAAGDESALRTLYDRHATWLWVRLMRRCNDEDVVADVLQDTFLAVWRGAGRWRGDGEVAAWIWGISVRRLISRLRVHRAPAPAPQETIDSAGVEAESAEELVLLGVEHGDVGAALRRLSPELRAVVQATLLDGLTTREAARLLRIPQGTVKGRLRRVKELLRADLTTAAGLGGMR